jgi:lipopolysaccharide biosynthesis regulator YciM
VPLKRFAVSGERKGENLVSLKTIFLFLVFSAFALYIAFLNPQDVDFHLTQNHQLRLPAVALIFISVFLGILASAVVYWIGSVGSLLRRMRFAARIRRRTKRRLRQDARLASAEKTALDGDWQSAIVWCRKILDRDPDHLDALLHLGDALRVQGEIREAVDVHARGAALAPENAKFLYSLAADYEAEGSVHRQIEVLNKIRQSEESALSPLIKLRDAHIKISDWKNAGDIQKAILTLQQKSQDQETERDRLGNILSQFALQLYEQGDTQGAVTAFKEAIKENGRLPSGYLFLGDIYAQKGESKPALKIWKSGFDTTLAPVFLQRIQNILESGKHHGDIVRAYEAAIQMTEDSQRQVLVLMLGSYFLQNNMTEQAIKVLESEPEGASLLHHVLLTVARETLKRGNGKTPKELQSLFDKARQALFRAASKEPPSPLEP